MAAHPTTGGDDLAVLVTAARDGCRSAFDDVMRATYDDTYRLALRLTGNHDDASEVAQDTYVRAFRHLRRFRGDASIATWLYRITANCASTLRTRQRRHRYVELTDELQIRDSSPEHDPETVLLTAEFERRLRRAIEELPPRLRDVLVLRDVHELSHEAIAARLAITTSAAKVRLHRARRKLRGAVFGDSADGDLLDQVSPPASSSPVVGRPPPHVDGPSAAKRVGPEVRPVGEVRDGEVAA